MAGMVLPQKDAEEMARLNMQRAQMMNQRHSLIFNIHQTMLGAHYQRDGIDGDSEHLTGRTAKQLAQQIAQRAVIHADVLLEMLMIPTAKLTPKTKEDLQRAKRMKARLRKGKLEEGNLDAEMERYDRELEADSPETSP